MRKIILITSILPAIALAVPKLTYEMSQDSSQQSLGYSTGTVVTKAIDRTQTVLNIADDSYQENYNYSIGLSYDIPDYSMVLIRDEFGGERVLSEIVEEKAEYNVNASIGYGTHGHSIDFGINSALGESPYANKGFNTAYKFAFFNSTSTIGANYSFSSQKRPVDYYTEPGTFAVIKRAEEIETHEIGIIYDQVLGARVKSYFEVGRILENDERPTQSKLSAKLGVALTESTFLKGGVGYFKEDTDQKLKNERGYFTANSFESEIIYEYNFDHMLSLGYDLVFEDEETPFNNTITRSAFDQYGIGFKSSWTADITTNFKLRYAESNLDTKEVYFVGGFEWAL